MKTAEGFLLQCRDCCSLDVSGQPWGRGDLPGFTAYRLTCRACGCVWWRDL